MPESLEEGRRESPPEAQPLVTEKTSTGLKVLASAIFFILISSALINFNKYMMQADMFPYSVALTWIHMFGSFTFALILYGFVGERWFVAMENCKGAFWATNMRFLPISISFAISIALSNEAYRYCSVPFLQMCKEFNVVMVYTLGLLLGAEVFNAKLAAVLLIVTTGCAMSVKGEMMFNAFGFMLQMGCQLGEVVKILTQQKVMQGYKLDPLTTVLFLAPQCMVWLSVLMPFVWPPNNAILLAAKTHWLLLVGNAAVAFLLNLAVANLIGLASGLTMTICGVMKDLCIVLAAAVIFSAQISTMQGVGFATALFGVAAYSTVRSAPDVVEKEGIIRTLGFYWCRIALPGKDM